MTGTRLLRMALMVAVAASSACTQYGRRDTHESLNGLLWVQTSAEYRTISAAIYRDAWAEVARMLEEAKDGQTPPSAALEQSGTNTLNLPMAILMDLDETVLDNSPMTGRLVMQRRPYDPSVWWQWVERERAELIPGAGDFIAKARTAGIEVIFVTNRTEAEEASTIKDLLPMVVTDDEILASGETGPGETAPWENEKTARRAFAAKKYWIIALVGDDLGDFIPGIRKMLPEDRVKEADKHLGRFGSQWFLLPNPIYGSWETVLYDRNDPDKKQLVEKMKKVKAF